MRIERNSELRYILYVQSMNAVKVSNDEAMQAYYLLLHVEDCMRAVLERLLDEDKDEDAYVSDVSPILDKYEAIALKRIGKENK